MSKRSATDAPPNGAPNPKRREILAEEEEEGTLLTVLDLTFGCGFFALEDLQALLNTSKAIAEPLCSFGGWKDHFVNDKVEVMGMSRGRAIVRRENPLGLAPPVGRIDTTNWPAPHLPPDYSTHDLHLPPRPRARTQKQPDRRSYYPARGDAPGYVLATGIVGSLTPLQRFNKETGVMEDLFYSANDDPGPDWGMVVHRTPHYIPRPLPIVCHDCNVTCTSYASLVEHCCTLQHQLNKIPRDRRIPKEFWDPRNQPSYSNKTPFEQVKACLQYMHMIVDFLCAPMDEAGTQNMQEQLEGFTDYANMCGLSTEHITLERVKEAYVNFVLYEFAQNGMEVHGYCRDVILGGWGRFQSHGTSSSEALFFSVVGHG